MLVLVSGATATHARFADRPCFGHLVTPRGGHDIRRIAATGQRWAADNDAFSGFDPDAFRRMLNRIADRPRCLFVACPDVVGDARATRGRFDEWQPEIAALGLPVALVGQDGAEDMDLPWDRLAAFFVGGSTEWKESRAAMELCDEAAARGKWVHVGRVNTVRRLEKLWAWGNVDSIDGTCFSKWPDKYFPWFIRHIDRLRRQPTFWGAQCTR